MQGGLVSLQVGLTETHNRASTMTPLWRWCDRGGQVDQAAQAQQVPHRDTVIGTVSTITLTHTHKTIAAKPCHIVGGKNNQIMLQTCLQHDFMKGKKICPAGSHLDPRRLYSDQRPLGYEWLQHALLPRPVHLSSKYTALCACIYVCAQVRGCVRA